MIKIGGSKKETALCAYPGYAYPTGDGWKVYVSGVAWRTPVVFNRRQRMMIRMLGGVMQASSEQLEGELFQSRITPFMADADKKRHILVSINEKIYRLPKKTRKNGHFFGRINVSQPDMEAALASQKETDSKIIRYSVSIRDDDAPPAEALIYLHDRRGLSVVSDIDDTIKDSVVVQKRELLVNTFLREFRAIPGMADVYSAWAESGAKFHYVSSSPWQLYDSLLSMHDTHEFPVGTMHLRNFRLRDQFLKKLMIRRKGKYSAIRELMQAMPERDFVLVGDSGEKDTKIYTKICRRFPERVKGVFIREIPEKPSDPEKFEKLQAAAGSALCATFKDAENLAQLARGIFASGAVLT